MHEAASFVMSARSLDEGLYLHSLPVPSLTFSASRSTSSLPPMHCSALQSSSHFRMLKSVSLACFSTISTAASYRLGRISRCFNVIDSRPDFMKLLVELVPLCIGERLADTWHQKGMKLAP